MDGARARRMLVAAGLLAAGSAFVFVGPPVCPTALLLGIPCPGCGLTRATLALLRGDIAGALPSSPARLRARAALRVRARSLAPRLRARRTGERHDTPCHVAVGALTDAGSVGTSRARARRLGCAFRWLLRGTRAGRDARFGRRACSRPALSIARRYELTLKRKWTTSPSRTTYSLPSMASLPASRHLASLPSAT